MISQSIIFTFSDTNCGLWCKVVQNNLQISSMPVHGSKGVQAFCTFCIYLYMARTCNWQKKVAYCKNCNLVENTKVRLINSRVAHLMQPAVFFLQRGPDLWL